MIPADKDGKIKELEDELSKFRWVKAVDDARIALLDRDSLNVPAGLIEIDAAHIAGEAMSIQLSVFMREYIKLCDSLEALKHQLAQGGPTCYVVANIGDTEASKYIVEQSNITEYLNGHPEMSIVGTCFVVGHV